MNFGPRRSSRRSVSDLDPDRQRTIAALRERLREPPARQVRERQLERIVAEARSAAAGPRPARLPGLSSRRVRAAVATGAVVIGLPAAAAGLATAGVKLPEPAVSVFEAIGVTLPNQAASSDDQQEGRSASPGDRDGTDQRRPDRVPDIPAAQPTPGPGSASPGQGNAAGAPADPRSPGAPPAPGGGADGSGGPPEGTPSGPSEATPSGPSEATPSGPPASTPSGPPASTPSGPPEGTPSGPSEATPSGPPASTPSGPPQGTPSGPAAGTSGDAPEGMPSGSAGTTGGGDRYGSQAQDVGSSADAQRE